MKTSTKIWLIVASLLVLIGGILFIWGFSMLNWNFKNLSSNKFQSIEYETNLEFENISINVDTSDVKFVLSTNDKCKVVCYEQQNINHTVKFDNNTLTIERVDNRKWYEYINFGFKNQAITVYLPKTIYNNLYIEGHTGDIEIPKDFTFNSVNIIISTGDVECYANATESMIVKASTGDIDLLGVTVGSLDLSVSTGEINLFNTICNGDALIRVSTGETEINNLTCNNFSSNGATGDIELNSVIANGKLTIKRTTGDVKLNRSDASEINITTSTGSVKGSLLSGKVFIVNTDTGHKRVPNTVTGGICEISTDTGDVIISLID